ncbi:MAG: hypothetical protein IBX45_11845 [Campylobacterales bacterium]|nr:hypothetical protein [Campylobacterales bacterium]
MKKVLLTLGVSASLVLTSSLAYDKEEAKKVFSCKGFAQAMNDYGFKFRENAVNFQRQSNYATINLDTTWERVCIDVTDGRIKLFSTKEEQEKLNIAHLQKMYSSYPQFTTPPALALSHIASIARDDVLKNEDKTIANVFEYFGGMKGMTFLFDSETFYSLINQNEVVSEAYNFLEWLRATKPDAYSVILSRINSYSGEKMGGALAFFNQLFNEYKGAKDG